MQKAVVIKQTWISHYLYWKPQVRLSLHYSKEAGLTVYTQEAVLS